MKSLQAKLFFKKGARLKTSFGRSGKAPGKYLVNSRKQPARCERIWNIAGKF